ncbi:MAG: hypothetical protein BGO98_30190 [Myxococcales bacterium 68-20]|nr:MAG: hypothetical protein BGO98_30190 [Myxococcales bacterium 68-20]
MQATGVRQVMCAPSRQPLAVFDDRGAGRRAGALAADAFAALNAPSAAPGGADHATPSTIAATSVAAWARERLPSRPRRGSSA